MLPPRESSPGSISLQISQFGGDVFKTVELGARAPPQMGQICASGAVKALSVEEAAGAGDAPGKSSLCTWSPSLVGRGGGAGGHLKQWVG